LPAEPFEVVLGRLYALPPEQFVAERDAAVAAARHAGARADAAAIARLRRPTVAAWLVNLLARQRPELIGELLDLGSALREAQYELRGSDLRELSERRRAAVAALVEEARRLAPPQRRASLPLGEVEATLGAALAEPEVAERVRAGTLTKAVGYAGFGEVPRPRLRLIDGGAGLLAEAEPPAEGVPAGRAGKVTEADSEQRARAEEAAAERAEAARTRAKAAQAELRRATQAEQDAARALAELSTQLDDLRRRHTQAEVALREARMRRKTAERAARRIDR
jgi:hypothetical protein